MATYKLAAVGVAAALSSSPALALGGMNSASLSGVTAPALATPVLGGMNSASLSGVAAPTLATPVLGGMNSASLSGVAAPTLATPVLGGMNSASLNGVAHPSGPAQEMMSVKVETIRLNE